ncbi:MAG: DUF2520 domain-containing protein [Rikenellaceae bacterium]|nr:DUF2520 domain-containing protein [Rikenellaceae bacterium]MCL2692941.1 DUF2520 domain-containing protein [Rikenellaceae bacterium]
MKKIVIIGSGNVAEALVRGLSGAGCPPVQVWARGRTKATDIARLCGCAFATEVKELAPADVYIIAVTDRAIRQVAASFNFPPDSVVAHTAGSVGMDVFPPQVKNRAVLYPVQTFTKGRTVDFSETPLLIEGSSQYALRQVTEVAQMLSDKVRQMSSERRMMVHAAAVFACNFANHMYSVGEELTREAGADFEILKPLIAETAGKAVAARSPCDVQTGPAVRNDFETRSRHVELLAQKPYLQNIYINISKSIWETSKKT